MIGSELYDLLVSHYKRLHPEISSWEDKMSEVLRDQMYRSVISDLVFSRVPASISLEALKTTNEKGIQIALELTDIQSKSLEIIKLMEQSNTWEEFEEKDKQPPDPKKELTDFDKILKGMLKVPKPDKDKKDKEGD